MVIGQHISIGRHNHAGPGPLAFRGRRSSMSSWHFWHFGHARHIKKVGKLLKRISRHRGGHHFSHSNIHNRRGHFLSDIGKPTLFKMWWTAPIIGNDSLRDGGLRMKRSLPAPHSEQPHHDRYTNDAKSYLPPPTKTRRGLRFPLMNSRIILVIHDNPP